MTGVTALQETVLKRQTQFLFGLDQRLIDDDELDVTEVSGCELIEVPVEGRDKFLIDVGCDWPAPDRDARD